MIDEGEARLREQLGEHGHAARVPIEEAQRIQLTRVLAY
jgi:hypothetical protein